ncbi:uncharacterized protein LOC118007555 [Mirounga leonina]|uniref:uncharacterized protein LOC118007555 n=1 Tax=Mirounga leonina TaxID=9715 RepID=UPI00156C106B|nr:uncharacterized protein LOC118007555 [Mirounga leonina]
MEFEKMGIFGEANLGWGQGTRAVEEVRDENTVATLKELLISWGDTDSPGFPRSRARAPPAGRASSAQPFPSGAAGGPTRDFLPRRYPPSPWRAIAVNRTPVVCCQISELLKELAVRWACKRSFGGKRELIQIGAKRGIRMGAVGPDGTTGAPATWAEQDVHRDPQKVAAALRTQAHRCHTAHLFQKSKESGFLCEMPPTKHICGPAQPKVAAWGAGAALALSLLISCPKRGCQ